MKPQAYQQFIERLTRNLEADSRVLGLVACGSMAQNHHMPDAWSDHDFWVVAQPGTSESFRADLSWLPDHEEIVLSFRETSHGVKIVYREGHLLESAVFEPADLPSLRINAYRVLLDRSQVAEVMQRIAEQTAQTTSEWFQDDRHRFGQILTNLMVGVGRYARGEKLSGHAFIKQYALHNVLFLLAKYGDSARIETLDNLDPLRRFEFAFPEWGAEINAILLLEPPQAARQLLDLADRALRDRMTYYPAEGVTAIRRYLAENSPS